MINRYKVNIYKYHHKGMYQYHCVTYWLWSANGQTDLWGPFDNFNQCRRHLSVTTKVGKSGGYGGVL